jgi:hypothetical protein
MPCAAQKPLAERDIDMTVLSFVEKLALGDNDSIMLYRGVTLSGKNFFAYLRCDKQGVEKLRRDYMAPGARDLNMYGEIIYMDFLAEPDARAEDFLLRYLKAEEKIAQLSEAV